MPTHRPAPGRERTSSSTSDALCPPWASCMIVVVVVSCEPSPRRLSRDAGPASSRALPGSSSFSRPQLPGFAALPCFRRPLLVVAEVCAAAFDATRARRDRRPMQSSVTIVSSRKVARATPEPMV